MSSRGYLVLAHSGYAPHAELLAASIRATQSTVNRVSIVTDQSVDATLFDHVIDLPEQDLSTGHDWKIHNRAHFYDLTPYDETVMLDADMLFLTDVSYWWTNMSRYELLLTKQVLDYRGLPVMSSPYRKTFESNQLPNVYSAFVYFRKTPLAQTFFTLVKNIIGDWPAWTAKYSPSDTQPWPSMDVAMAMALKIMGREHSATSNRNYPTFTHMKSGCQSWNTYPTDWRDVLNVYATEKGLRLGDYYQTGVLHYVAKDFITNDIQGMFK